MERWFEEADINTCIVILEKCKDTRERDENLVRFVYLFKPLRHFVPPAQDIWEKQKERLHAIDELKKTILFHNEFYQTDDFRVYPKMQKELWEEGFDEDSRKYEGAKWGKYLRAPEIFFKILEKSKGKLVPLKKLADVRFGIKTGANKFFYLTEEEIQTKGIEKEFWMHKDEKGNWVPNKIIVSPREGKQVVLVPGTLKKNVLFVSENKSALRRKKMLTHIRQGERRGFHKRPTCSSRKMWYELEKREAWPILHPMVHNERQVVLFNKYGVQVDHNLFEIRPKSDKDTNGIFCFLLSTVGMLLKEFGGRTNLGQGALKTEGIDIEKLFIPKNISKKQRETLENFLDKNSTMEIGSIFQEVGAASIEVTLDKIRSDRRELDEIVMGDILGLNEEEQLEVYKAVVDLVKSRIERAKSVKKKGKVKEGVDVEHVSRVIMEKLGKGLYRKFYEEKVLNQKDLKDVKLFSPGKEPVVDNSLFGWRILSGKDFIQCENEHEAKYLKIWLDAGLTDEVKVPTEKKYLKLILPELENLQTKISKIIAEHLESITSQKLQAKIMHHLQRSLFEEDHRS